MQEREERNVIIVQSEKKQNWRKKDCRGRKGVEYGKRGDREDLRGGVGWGRCDQNTSCEKLFLKRLVGRDVTSSAHFNPDCFAHILPEEVLTLTL